MPLLSTPSVWPKSKQIYYPHTDLKGLEEKLQEASAIQKKDKRATHFQDHPYYYDGVLAWTATLLPSRYRQTCQKIWRCHYG